MCVCVHRIFTETPTPQVQNTQHPLTQNTTMKQNFFLALLTLAAIGAAAAQFEDDDVLRGGEGAHKTQCRDGQAMAMNACGAYLMKQCTASTMPLTWPWKWRMGSCRELKRRCCSQLEQVPPTCRCSAIRSTVQEMQGSMQQGGGHYMMSKVKQMAKTLPSICSMHPSTATSPPPMMRPATASH